MTIFWLGAIEQLNMFAMRQFNGSMGKLNSAFSQRGLQVLRALGTPDCTAGDAAKVVGWSKSLVSYGRTMRLGRVP